MSNCYNSVQLRRGECDEADADVLRATKVYTVCLRSLDQILIANLYIRLFGKTVISANLIRGGADEIMEIKEKMA